MKKIEDLKKGEFFKRSETAKKVFCKGEYNRAAKAYEGIDEADFCNVLHFKKGKEVFVNFEY